MRTLGVAIRSLPLSVGFLLALGLLSGSFGIMGCSKKPPLSAEEKTLVKLEELRTHLTVIVQDPARLDPMLNLVDRGSEQLRTQAALMAKLLDEQERLNQNYNATPEAFQAIGERLRTQQKDNYDKAMAIRFALAKLATDDEWKKITKLNLGLLGF